MAARKPYPSDVGDEEWDFVAPDLILFPLDASQRQYALREVFNALRWLVRSGAPWRLLPHDFPPWHKVYQQTQRWFKAGCFETMAQDLRALLRLASGKEPSPSAAIFDSRTLQSTPESGARAGYDGAKRRKGSKVHLAVDTLGHLLALHVTPANIRDRDQVAQLAQDVPWRGSPCGSSSRGGGLRFQGRGDAVHGLYHAQPPGFGAEAASIADIRDPGRCVPDRAGRRRQVGVSFDDVSSIRLESDDLEISTIILTPSTLMSQRHWRDSLAFNPWLQLRCVADPGEVYRTAERALAAYRAGAEPGGVRRPQGG